MATDSGLDTPPALEGATAWRRRFVRVAWGRRGGPTRRAATVCLLLGLVVTSLGLAIVVFGPPTISASDFQRLPECSGDPVPNDGSCFSLTSGHLVSVGIPDGYLFVHFDDRLGQHEEQILNASYEQSFRAGGEVSLKYWHDLVVAVQVPGTATLAPTFRNPAQSLAWGTYERTFLLVGVLFFVTGIVWRRRSTLDQSQARAIA